MSEQRFESSRSGASEAPLEGYECLAGGEEMGALMRALDWSKTPFGAVEQWSQSLRSTISICLNSRFPMAIYWGGDCLLLYNDAWRPIVGDKHPWALGRPGHEVWSEIWTAIGAECASVLTTGKGTFHNDELLSMHRFGYTEECYFDYTMNPIQGEKGVIDGILNIVSETTYRVLNDRRARLLREVASKTGIAKTAEEACDVMISTLQSDPADIPFSMLYLIDTDGKRARLCGGNAIVEHQSVSPTVINLEAADHWSIVQAVRTAEPQIIHNLVARFGVISGSPWSEPPQKAMILPIVVTTKTTAVLVAGVSPRLELDENYRDFFTQVARQIATAIANARSYEEERQRTEQLAKLDRAKTVFFSNVSHEFRTPLTLMLSPTEDALQDAENSRQRDRLELIHRNALRLQKLVNTLLDFSRIEAGRIEALYEPTDLAVLTTDLAGMFRSTIERAGLRLQVECEAFSEPVYVDREMWEKIVLNLLSNAFKFTLAGEIAVVLKENADQIQLEVRDTGTGIPESELAHVFERFHRVKGAKGRSYEGSGIGLSLVQELVKLHGGTIEVCSILDQGTCFTVSIPKGFAHLPSDRIRVQRSVASTSTGAIPYIEEALRWLPSDDLEIPRSIEIQAVSAELPVSVPSARSTTASPARIVLADDNADMRDYLKRLLSQQYEVEAVSDGKAALAAIHRQMPDLLLSDVMMPEIDGFELLQLLRNPPEGSPLQAELTARELPIILLSARAGEEARIEGLEAGADDYLTKPFSARELLARVEAILKLSQLRQEALKREQALRSTSETAQLQAEAAYQRIDRLLESMSDAFVALDRDWRITYQNATAERINNKPRSEIIGKTLWEEWPAAIGSIADQQYRRAIAEQIPVHFEHRYYEPPDHDVWLETHAYPFEDGLGIFYRDISDRKKAEEALRESLGREHAARETAEAANRIKDEFLAVLSHELRTPLNPILGWSKLLKSGTLDATRSAQAIEIIERNAKLQTQLIEDLLDVSRILQGKLSLNMIPVDVEATINAALETVQLAAEAKSIQVQVDLSSTLQPVLGDAARLQQVVWNLLSNAIKFTPEGGRVEIRLEQSGTQVQITVSDTGKGITPDFLPYVFEYFRQADGATTRKFGGLGLGLAIVRQIVELHGGTIQAESLGEDQGATFTVRLPGLKTRREQNCDHPNSSSDEASLANICILVVDDEEDSLDLVAFILKQSGATVTAVSSATEALEVLDQTDFDVLVSDIGMPEMNGYMLMQQIQQRSHVPGAIALTAYAGELNQQQAIAAGFQEHLAKPVDSEALVKTILALMS